MVFTTSTSGKKYIYNKYKTVVFDLSVFCVQSSILRILNEHLNTTLKKIFD